MNAAEISDRDLILVRLRFIDIINSFFQGPPDAEKIARWRGIFAALTREQINPQLDTAAARLAHTLSAKNLQGLQDEYYALYIDPYSKSRLPLNASYYLDGRSFGPSLAELRELLKKAQLVRTGGISEPEDSLQFMLDTLFSLVEEERQGSSKAIELQGELLQHFLIPTVTRIVTEATANEKADFYLCCFLFLKEYLELEQGLVAHD